MIVSGEHKKVHDTVLATAINSTPMAKRIHITPLTTYNSLADREHTTTDDFHGLTCFQRMLPIPNMPLPQLRIQRRPKNMMETNGKFRMNMIMMAILLCSMLGRLQPTLSVLEEWSCKQLSISSQGKSRSSFTWEITDAEPHSISKGYYLSTEGRPALYGKCHVNNPYASCKKYHNIILPPYCNTNRFFEYPLRKGQNNGKENSTGTYVQITSNNKAMDHDR
jgi:hypothetical protein